MITPDLFRERTIMLVWVNMQLHYHPKVVVIALTWADIPWEGGSHLPPCEPLLDLFQELRDVKKIHYPQTFLPHGHEVPLIEDKTLFKL